MTTPFDDAERRIRSGRAETYARQVLNSRGPEGMAAARPAYVELCAEFRSVGGLLALPYVALLARGRA